MSKDINLPPLPEAVIVSYQTDSTMRRMELRTYSDEDMQAYAHTAVEADRQQRGEPVASDVERMATTRYRPVPDGLMRYKVVAGDGTRALFHGTKDECHIVARKLTEAFLDGAFATQQASLAPSITIAQEPTGYFYPWELERSKKTYPGGFHGAVAVYAAPVAAQAQPTMPALTDAMRAVLRNEHCVYDSEDTLYAALCNAAGPAPSAQDREDADHEVLAEHSGCGRGTQVEQVTVKLNPGDKVVMVKGRITMAIDATRASLTPDMQRADKRGSKSARAAKGE